MIERGPKQLTDQTDYYAPMAWLRGRSDAFVYTAILCTALHKNLLQQLVVLAETPARLLRLLNARARPIPILRRPRTPSPGTRANAAAKGSCTTSGFAEASCNGFSYRLADLRRESRITSYRAKAIASRQRLPRPSQLAAAAAVATTAAATAAAAIATAAVAAGPTIAALADAFKAPVKCISAPARGCAQAVTLATADARAAVTGRRLKGTRESEPLARRADEQVCLCRQQVRAQQARERDCIP
eukprot:362147-Chlamydomonas_euryale.AAC.4